MSTSITSALLREAIDCIVRYQFATVPTLQRKLGVGFVAAAALMEELERLGVVGDRFVGIAREVRYASTELDQALALVPPQQ